ncbi:Sodium/solute symporter [Penicillium riverlandense]|uniref:Sodium/solute symporter n=1 Tax=Penicillium riverlandense TaxID=1903569 RepID=UPI0025473EBB|nr:Sodium/solute symporter [Penicillium riverlandense]KAJ5833351.1 Sodium/solute symporter [Penicillium riverlandense]
MSNTIDTAKLALIPQGAAYGLLIGLGVLFCGVILVAIRVQKAYLSEDSGKSEMFMVANRSVGTGLTASAVFSSWMWINETVLAAAMTYRYGLALPLWWGSGLCFQIVLMAALGVMAKIRVPYAHTSLEIVRMRYGRIAHLTFIGLNLVNNVFGCASMIMTGSQLIYGVSGMNFVAATILIPLGVVLYTAVGGLKATFLTDFLHTAIALILIIYFTLAVLTNSKVGGLSGLYDKVVATANDNYVSGNYEGSLLTFKSKGAIIWGLILKFGNLALVVMDTAFWQKSFATEVRATVPGYIIAALAVFGIPWGLGTVIGLATRAIHNTPIFPTYPGPLTDTEVNMGMVMPYTLKALIGDRGIIGFFFLLFMALTSTVSSSLIAVSSILSYDVYKTYLNPQVTDKRLVRVSHLTVVIHGVFITGISIAMNYGGANMTWINYLRPVISCPGIIPLVLTLFWSRQTRLAAIVAPVLGFFTGLAVWLATAKSMYGAINIDTTSNEYPALYAAIASFFSPGLYSVVLSLYKPHKFDWREFLRIELADEAHLHAGSYTSTLNESSEQEQSSSEAGSMKPLPASKQSEPTNTIDLEDTGALREKSPVSATLAVPASLDDIQHPFDKETLKELYRWLKIASILFIIVVLVTFVAWPLPLYRDYIFTKPFFSGWTTVAIIWQFGAFGAVVVFPLYDGRHAIARGVRGVSKSSLEYFNRGKLP